MLRELDRNELAFVVGGAGEEVPEIVVMAKVPREISLGSSGWTAQFYSDGIAVLRFMGGAPQARPYTMDFGPNTQTATATVPPSVSATNTGMTYHFGDVIPYEGGYTGPGGDTPKMPN